jgi:phosphatidylserine decarboxylase
MSVFKLAPYGNRELIIIGGAALLIIIAGAALAFFLKKPALLLICVPGVLVWFCGAAFFRNPDRNIPAAPELIVSPADGVVRDIELIPLESDEEVVKFFGKPMLRVGIFLSVFNVHVNRMPCRLTVEYDKYKEGAFHDARNPAASKENEAMTIAGTGSAAGKTFPVAVRQISGAIARRIVCKAAKGSAWEKGELYGMIKFGSRTELYLPAGQDFEILVKPGDKVSGGSTVIAKIKD